MRMSPGNPVQIVCDAPSKFSADAIDDFKALVLAGGEVVSEGLTELIGEAEALVFLTVGDTLCGVAGLKRPRQEYRQKIESRSAFALPAATFPFELGWLFVMPSSRGRRFSGDLARAALSACNGQGVFATTSKDAMVSTLNKCGFTCVGRAWESTKNPGTTLRLFTLPA